MNVFLFLLFHSDFYILGTFVFSPVIGGKMLAPSAGGWKGKGVGDQLMMSAPLTEGWPTTSTVTQLRICAPVFTSPVQWLLWKFGSIACYAGGYISS